MQNLSLKFSKKSVSILKFMIKTFYQLLGYNLNFQVNYFFSNLLGIAIRCNYVPVNETWD